MEKIKEERKTIGDVSSELWELVSEVECMVNSRDVMDGLKFRLDTLLETYYKSGYFTDRCVTQVTGDSSGIIVMFFRDGKRVENILDIWIGVRA